MDECTNDHYTRRPAKTKGPAKDRRGGILHPRPHPAPFAGSDVVLANHKSIEYS